MVAWMGLLEAEAVLVEAPPVATVPHVVASELGLWGWREGHTRERKHWVKSDKDKQTENTPGTNAQTTCASVHQKCYDLQK